MTTRAAYETDNGPGGMSWEVWDLKLGTDEVDLFVKSCATREEAEELGSTEFHTYADWEAEQEEEDR